MTPKLTRPEPHSVMRKIPRRIMALIDPRIILFFDREDVSGLGIRIGSFL
jgi:hypothetical protein